MNLPWAADCLVELITSEGSLISSRQKLLGSFRVATSHHMTSDVGQELVSTQCRDNTIWNRHLVFKSAMGKGRLVSLSGIEQRRSQNSRTRPRILPNETDMDASVPICSTRITIHCLEAG